MMKEERRSVDTQFFSSDDPLTDYEASIWLFDFYLNVQYDPFMLVILYNAIEANKRGICTHSSLVLKHGDENRLSQLIRK